LELSSVEDSEDRIDDYPMTSDLKILVIDDNDEVRSFITDYLKTDYKIVEATDGFRGWEIATFDLPDLIITDIMMPGMDGFELCKKLKSDERTSHIPVIMLTARAMSMDRLEGLQTGADDYIIKPFSMEELSVRIRNLLEQRERLKEKYANLIDLNLGEKMTVTTLDDQFLKKATTIISENLHDFRFNVSTLQDKMNMSSSNLYRKIKALTGDSPVQLLRNMRLKLAADLIQKNNQSITEVMLQVGFSNLSYFSRSFKSLYGVTPKVFQKSRPRKAKPSHQSN
jgi:DNA-binding response OmpR family regulator